MTINLTIQAIRAMTLTIGLVMLNACGISAETQALIDEFNRTIPVCEGNLDCGVKWEAARNWVVTTPSYPIRVSNQDRIETYDANSTRAGTEIRVNREPLGDDRYRIVVDIDCFGIDACPPFWETKIDFNRVVGSAGQ